MCKTNSVCLTTTCHFFLVVVTVPALATSDPRINQKIIGQDSPCSHCDGPCFQNRCLFDGPDEADSLSLVQEKLQNHSSQTESVSVAPTVVSIQTERPSALFLETQAASTDTGSLREKLWADQQQLQSLQSENMQLRLEKAQVQQQFRTWATALGRITAREAHMAEIVGAAKVDPSKLTDANTWKDAGSTITSHGSSISSWILSIPSGFKGFVDTLQGFIFLIVLLVAAALIYRFRSRVLMLIFETEEVKISWQDIVWGVLSCGGCCWPLEPVGRAVGLAYKTIEISEIQLGHLPLRGDVFVQIDIGTNPLMHTRTINRSDGVFLRFRELFKVNVRKTDPACVFKVMDQDMLVHDEIAKVEINAWEFCKLAGHGSKKGASGCYRFDLQHGQRRNMHAKGHTEGVRPYIAFRLREVTDDANKFKGISGSADARRSQRDFEEMLKTQPGQTHFALDPNTNELNLP